MELADKTVGFLLSLTSLSIFTYYTFWVIILVSSSPMFIDDDLPNVISFSELDHIHEYISWKVYHTHDWMLLTVKEKVSK